MSGPAGASGAAAAPDGEVRQATPDDYEAVAAFTADIWSDRGGDYIPRIYHDWIEGDGPRQRTFVYDDGDDLAGIVQGVLLSDDEAWAQGMRVNPDYRGAGVSTTMNDVLFDWAAERGATVCRNMVFSWNAPALGASRATGFEPCTEFRWAQPDPDPDAAVPETVREDPAAAWRAWQGSDADTHLRGLAVDLDESWSVAELTRERLARAADEQAVFAVVDDGARGMTYRTRTYDREGDGETVTWAEYGVGAWRDLDAARAVLAAVRRDAADIGADRTRVLVPETVRYVSDASRARAAVSDEPAFVLAADLTDRQER